MKTNREISILVLVLSFVFFSCAQEKPVQTQVSSTFIGEIADTNCVDTIDIIESLFSFFNIETKDTSSYKQKKLEAEALRIKLKNAYAGNVITIDSVGAAFEEFLLNKIIPHWYGTPWAFEGHTNVPNNGEVACGYFVSTTLRHMEIQLNRYHLAQQAASNGAKSLAVDFDNISKFYNIEAFENDLTEGLYTVGLSYHVGYLLKRKGQLFFIHSNYLASAEVMIEYAEESEALQSSSVFVIVKVGNADLMKKWLDGTQVKIYRQ